MNKLLIAALALGACAFTQSAISAPAASPVPGMIQTNDGLMQNVRDRDGDWNENRGYHRGWDHNRRGFWGHENRSWRDDKWRGGHKRDWDNDHRGRDRD